MQSDHQRNGYAFEYALIKGFEKLAKNNGFEVEIEEDSSLKIKKENYEELKISKNQNYLKLFKEIDLSASPESLKIFEELEPILVHPEKFKNKMKIRSNSDITGIEESVSDLDLIFGKNKVKIPISAKNNNDSIKHRRLPNTSNLGEDWAGVKWEDQEKVLQKIEETIKTIPKDEEGKYKGFPTWTFCGEKIKSEMYLFIMECLVKYFESIANNPPAVGSFFKKLTCNEGYYTIERNPVYGNGIIKCFNIDSKLNKKFCADSKHIKMPKIEIPKRIKCVSMDANSVSTCYILFDNDAIISLRIHNKDRKALVSSLAFDTKIHLNQAFILLNRNGEDDEHQKYMEKT